VRVAVGGRWVLSRTELHRVFVRLRSSAVRSPDATSFVWLVTGVSQCTVCELCAACVLVSDSVSCIACVLVSVTGVRLLYAYFGITYRVLDLKS